MLVCQPPPLSPTERTVENETDIEPKDWSSKSALRLPFVRLSDNLARLSPLGSCHQGWGVPVLFGKVPGR